MFETHARFVTRGTDGDSGDVDLLIGTSFKGSCLKPNTVYSIKDIMGQLTLVEEGVSHLTKRDWSLEFQDVVVRNGKFMWLTKEEYEQLMKQREIEDDS